MIAPPRKSAKVPAAATAAAAPDERVGLSPLALVAGMSGNLMEWYDFALYGVLAATLGQLFFPQGSRLAALLSVFGVFAAGYLMRVLGGALFGHVGDRLGRRRALLLSAVAMPEAAEDAEHLDVPLQTDQVEPAQEVLAVDIRSDQVRSLQTSPIAFDPRFDTRAIPHDVAVAQPRREAAPCQPGAEGQVAEGGGGKIEMLDRGAFTGLDLAMMAHRAPVDVAEARPFAVSHSEIVFTGKSAHAAAYPEHGRNAADAFTIAQVALGLLRQQLPASERVHGIVTDGGEAPNAIPERTRGRWYARAE